jgi:hypothetical protein
MSFDYRTRLREPLIDLRDEALGRMPRRVAVQHGSSPGDRRHLRRRCMLTFTRLPPKKMHERAR